MLRFAEFNTVRISLHRECSCYEGTGLINATGKTHMKLVTFRGKIELIVQ
jgi:hypothetical protein